MQNCSRFLLIGHFSQYLKFFKKSKLKKKTQTFQQKKKIFKNVLLFLPGKFSGLCADHNSQLENK